MVSPACNNKETCKKCGYDCGFHWLHPILIKKDPYISASIFNASHDLLLLNYIKSYKPTPPYNKLLSDFLEKSTMKISTERHLKKKKIQVIIGFIL